ncbi:hypothetical protein CVT25_001366, partial [Psilocybe cyanescens]
MCLLMQEQVKSRSRRR